MTIEEYIKLTGISIAGLAKLANISAPMLYKYLDKTKPVSAGSALKLYLATKKIRPEHYGFDVKGGRIEKQNKESALHDSISTDAMDGPKEMREQVLQSTGQTKEA